MSYSNEAYVRCPDLQDRLDNYFQTCGSDKHRDPAPFFEYLMSASNRSGYSQIVAPGGAKLKTVHMTYAQAINESAVTTPGTERTCTASTKRGNLSVSCTIDPTTYWEVEEKISITDFRYLCESPSDLLPDKIQRMINALMSKGATVITNAAAPLLGDWSNDVPAARKESVGGIYHLKVPTVYSEATGVPDPRGMQRINSAMVQTNWCARGGAPIFSDLNLWEYYQIMKAGCCASSGIGLDKIMAEYGHAVMWDRRVAQATGNTGNIAWTMQPGSLQVVTYVENDNGVADAVGITTGTNYQTGVIYDPLTGFPIDLTIKDDCGQISIILRALGKLCPLPLDLFQGNHMDGVNFFAGIKVVNPA